MLIPGQRGGSEVEDGVGTPLGGTPYRLVRRLAEGGMGTVVEAVHVELDKAVAIKFLRATARPDLEHRLRQEARAMTRLDHPNLVRVTDLGRTHEGTPYLVMERLHGATLQSELRRRGPFAVPEALHVMAEALRGLDFAHRAGIIHRDVKLENLFYCSPAPDGSRTVKVLDFGIAKVLDATRGPESKHATEAGTIMGTPAFLSPEQALAGAVDARTDVYGAAVCLYRLLCGRDPFVCPAEVARGGAEARLLYLLGAHAKHPADPPSRWAAQAIPPALDALLLHALAKRPDDRPPSAAAFADALDAIRQDLDQRREHDSMHELLRASAASVATAPAFEPVDRTLPLAEPEPETVVLPAARVAPSLRSDAPHGRGLLAQPRTCSPLNALAPWQPRSELRGARETTAHPAHARRARLAAWTVYVAVMFGSALVTLALVLALRGALG